ncbi:MAG TPA: helix-turn-helix domain-containing protein [Planctomycetota bacterium]|nr:helix-turn-helix domain-containing protein [Planctomycetota bacterium]
MDKLMTIKGVAEFLNLSEKTVRRLIHKGELPASKVGGQWRMDKDTIELYLKKKAYFAGDIAIHQLYFRSSVLDVYRKQPEVYYIQEAGFHGRLGKKTDKYKLHSDRSNAWVVGAKADDLGTLPGEFPELRFYKVKLKNAERSGVPTNDGSDFAIMVEPKTFYRMPDEEQNKWAAYRILNPSI